MTAFLTGSLLYARNRFRKEGKDASDVDIVVRISPEEADLLLTVFTGSAGENSYPGSFSIKEGRINLIVCTEDSSFSYWRLGTELIYNKFRDTARSQAVAVFKEIKEKFSAYFIEAEAIRSLKRREVRERREAEEK